MTIKTVTATEVSDRLRLVLVECFHGSRAELQERCKIGRDTISNWFRREPAMPDLAQLAKVADIANVSLDWLVLGREPMEWPNQKTVDAPRQLFDAAYDRIKESLEENLRNRLPKGFVEAHPTSAQWDEALLKALDRWGPEGLWYWVVPGVRELAELAEAANDFLK